MGEPAARRYEALVLASDTPAAPAIVELIETCRRAGLAVVPVGGHGGPGDPPDVESALDALRSDGIAPGQVLLWSGGQPTELRRVLEDQLERRRRGDPPTLTGDGGWTYTVPALDRLRERQAEALLTVGNGRIGTRATLAAPIADSDPGVRIAGVYRGSGPASDLLPGPVWNVLAADGLPSAAIRRLDLRSGLLQQELQLPDGPLEVVELASLADPAVVALRARAPRGVLSAAQSLADPAGAFSHADRLAVAGDGATIAATAADLRTDEPDGVDRLERVVVYDWSGDARRDAATALASTPARSDLDGFEALLTRHRRAWAARWATSDVGIDGDPDLQLALRLGLYHLIAATPATGEGPVGARGLSGDSYRGHVFWDAEAFVLPFHAATEPRCARAMLEYRVARLPAALAEARDRGRAGARFPWESAADGREVTPPTGTGPTGEVVPILNGAMEDHIVADVAWAAQHYVAWTGDRAFADGPGRALLVETARFWASRIVVEADVAHIRNVIGPDEHHDDVDDNAYTNVMARWNLRAAARAVHGLGELISEAAHWDALADRLADGYDPASGRYEQFAGFFGLEPLVIADAVPSRPVSAPALLGAARVSGAQVVKQADVLMLHYLVPDELEASSLDPNLDFYEPRTAHGSTLSPGVHAALLARAGRADEALRWLRLTATIDIDDIGGTTAGGVHLAAMGSAWRTVAWGFAGIAPAGDALAVDPRPLPATWEALDVRLQFRGVPIGVRVTHDAVEVFPAAPIRVRWSASAAADEVRAGGARMALSGAARGATP